MTPCPAWGMPRTTTVMAAHLHPLEPLHSSLPLTPCKASVRPHKKHEIAHFPRASSSLLRPIVWGRCAGMDTLQCGVLQLGHGQVSIRQHEKRSTSKRVSYGIAEQHCNRHAYALPNGLPQEERALSSFSVPSCPCPAFGQRELTIDATFDCTVLLLRAPEDDQS